MDVEAFREESRKWLAEAKHPRRDRLYTELVYQPMSEVLNFLRALRASDRLRETGVEPVEAISLIECGIDHRKADTH